jgi:hypothetical protein
MSRGLTLALMVGAMAALMVSHAHTEPAAPAKPATNLQVLPQDMSPGALKGLMKQYERDLGVNCSYCHVEDRENGIVDYASDDNPRKHTARIMIAMLDEINSKHLGKLAGDRRYSLPVSCGSCHQGHANPQEFAP